MNYIYIQPWKSEWRYRVLLKAFQCYATSVFIFLSQNTMFSFIFLVAWRCRTQFKVVYWFEFRLGNAQYFMEGLFIIVLVHLYTPCIHAPRHTVCASTTPPLGAFARLHLSSKCCLTIKQIKTMIRIINIISTLSPTLKKKSNSMLVKITMSYTSLGTSYS